MTRATYINPCRAGRLSPTTASVAATSQLAPSLDLHPSIHGQRGRGGGCQGRRGALPPAVRALRRRRLRRAQGPARAPPRPRHQAPGARLPRRAPPPAAIVVAGRSPGLLPAVRLPHPGAAPARQRRRRLRLPLRRRRLTRYRPCSSIITITSQSGAISCSAGRSFTTIILTSQSGTVLVLYRPTDHFQLASCNC